MKFATCENGFYYDLVRVPHGHIPAPMVKFWKKLPIPIGGQRDTKTFHCINCGAPSFFKNPDYCFSCATYRWDSHDEDHKEKEKRRQRKKDIEYALLPILILLGKAWYLRTTRFRGDEHRTRSGEILASRG